MLNIYLLTNQRLITFQTRVHRLRVCISVKSHPAHSLDINLVVSRLIFASLASAAAAAAANVLHHYTEKHNSVDMDNIEMDYQELVFLQQTNQAVGSLWVVSTL